MEALGEAFDCAANRAALGLDQFFEMFVATGVADAFGAVGYRATNIAELREALRKAQQSEGPVLIDCQIDKDERVLPMIPAGGTIDDLVTD